MAQGWTSSMFKKFKEAGKVAKRRERWREQSCIRQARQIRGVVCSTVT
jgi:hypothetical protein